MLTRIVPTIALAAYGALLVKVMVFKDLPTIRVGQLMLNFAGTDAGHGPNFIPFATIGPYLMGHKGLIIAGVNLVGNIVLLVPLGFLVPFVYKSITWKKALMLSVASGLAIEALQTVLRVGIFDIDDVILNALGFMLGYLACVLLAQWLHARKYLYIAGAFLAVAAVAALAFAYIYPWGQPVTPGPGRVQPGEDLCGGTGGNGEIVRVEEKSFVMRRGDGIEQLVTLTEEAQIHTPAGPGTIASLKAGDRTTLVGGPNPDGSFTAEAVFVCTVPN